MNYKSVLFASSVVGLAIALALPLAASADTTTTNPATNITTSDATLNGTNASTTDALNASFWVSTSSPIDTSDPNTLPSNVYGSNQLGPVNADDSFSTQLSSTTGLTITPDTTYYFVAWTTPDNSTYYAGDTLSFTTESAPTITNVSPSSGSTAGGTPITITGTEFNSGTSTPTVTVGGNPATDIVVASSTQITADTPAGSGTVDVVVTNRDGGTATDPSAFTYTAPAPTTVYVNATDNTCGGNSPCYSTIQDGINAVAASGTVDVQGTNTYSEQLTITKSLTLTGAGTSTTAIAAPASLSGDDDIIDITGASTNVTMTGFTVEGPGPSSCGSINYGIYVGGGATADINNNTISDIANNPLGGCQNGRAIGAGNSSGDTGTLTADSNTVTGYQKSGIDVEGSGSTGTITNNIITGIGSTTAIAQNGVEINYGAVATVSGNTISGNEYNGTGSTPACGINPPGGPNPICDTQSAGILLYQAGAGVTISGNTTSGNDMGIYNMLGGVGTTTIENNTDSDRYESIVLDGGAANVTGNTITGGNIGIAAISYNSETMNTVGDLTNNTISNTTDSGIKILTDNNPADTFNDVVTANSNSISGNASGVTVDASTTVDATSNWWGSQSGPTIASNPNGTGDSIVDGNASSSVNYSPWLCAAGGTQTTTTGTDCTTSSSSSGGGGSSSGGGGGGGGNGPIAGSIGIDNAVIPIIPTTTTTTTTTTPGQVLGAAAYNFTRDLTLGDTGPDVTALQQMLIADGYSIPLLTSGQASYGYFGAQTQAALAAYQKDHGISPDVGYFGPITRAAFNQGTLPTMTDEQRSLLIQQLQQELNSILAQIQAMEAASTTTQ